MIDLITLFAQACGYTFHELTDNDRTMEVSLCRQMVWYKLRRLGYSTHQIARSSHRTHASVIYGTRRANELLSTKDKQACDYFNLINKAAEQLPPPEKTKALSSYSDKFGVSVFALMSDSRDTDLALKRFIIYHDMHRRGLKCEEIASLFNKTKQSVSHGIARVKDLEYTRDPKYIENINKLNS